MGETVILATGAAADPRQTQPVPVDGGCNCRWHVERQGAIGRGRPDNRHMGVHAGRDRFEVIVSELIAARTDRRSEHDVDHGLPKGSHRDVDDTSGETTPSGMHHGELAGVADQHERRAVGDPTAENDVIEIGDHDVAWRTVTTTGLFDANHPDTVPLVGHGPREVDQRSPATIELGEGLPGEVKIAVGSRRTANDDPAVAT